MSSPHTRTIALLASGLSLMAACSNGAGSNAPPGNTADAGPEAATATTGSVPRATVMLTQVGPRTTVDPAVAEPSDPSAVTAHWPITGEAEFRANTQGVGLHVKLVDCRTAYVYPTHIFEGDCGALASGTEPWDGVRGRLSSGAFCLGAPGASLYELREHAETTGWTLGGPPESDILGHSLAVLDPDTGAPLACGAIVADTTKPSGIAPPPPSAAVVHKLAGLCIFALAGGVGGPGAGSPQCLTDELATCTLDYCVEPCVAQCTDYVGCLASSERPCEAACGPSEACAICLADATSCTVGFCGDHLKACAPPSTPDGPCAELRMCCTRQGPLEDACFQFATMIEGFGGDPSCLGTLNDWDFNTNFAYRSPCYQMGFEP